MFYKLVTFALSSAMIGLIAGLDWVSAQKFSLYVLYALPIFLSAWFVGAVAGIFSCAIAVLFWMGVDLKLNAVDPLYIFCNAGLRLCFFVGISIVISSLKLTLDREKQWATTDYLTGLPNRRQFLFIANQERQRAERHKRPLTLAYIDLDNFKAFNDRSGHDVGDVLLKEVGAVLKTNIRASDTIARFGGDEFVALFPETNYEAGEIALHKLQDSLKKQMGYKQWNLSTSIGAVTYLAHCPPVNEMVLVADRLMYAAKGSGKNRIKHELS